MVPGHVHVWMRALADSLWMGVDLFFVLSGFLITGILLDTLNSERYFRNFYARRALRIFPLYYAVLLGFIVSAHRLHIVWGGQLATLLTYTNRIFIDPHHPGFHFWFGGNNNLVNFWSLAVEEQFYFVWPLLVFLCRKPRNVFMAALLLSLAIVAGRFYLVSRHAAADVIYVSLACRGDSLLVGAMLAAAFRHGYRQTLARMAPIVALAGLPVAGVLFVKAHGLNRETTGMMEFGYTLIALYFAALVVLSMRTSGTFARLCNSGWLRFFGRYSYGLYILHSVLPAFYAGWLLPWIAASIGHITISNIVIAIVKFAIAVGAAYVSYHVLEKPFLGLKRHFPSEKRRAAAEHAVAPAF